MPGLRVSAHPVRVVGIEAATAKRLTALRLKSKHSAASDPILPTRNGTHLLHSNVHRAWNTIREAAGLPDLHYHDLRHNAASLLHASGLSDAALAAAPGTRQRQRG
jgi:integrase